MGYHTLKDIIKILGICKNTIINWEKTGKIPVRRDKVFGHRYWTDEDLAVMKKLCDEIKGRAFEHYKGQNIYLYSPKVGKWKFQVIIHIHLPSEVRARTFCSNKMYSSKQEALKKAQQVIDEELKRITEKE